MTDGSTTVAFNSYASVPLLNNVGLVLPSGWQDTLLTAGLVTGLCIVPFLAGAFTADGDSALLAAGEPILLLLDCACAARISPAAAATVQSERVLIQSLLPCSA
eukprot:18738-Heterococcus_DN1.PRE.2